MLPNLLRKCLEGAIPSCHFKPTALADFVQHLPGQFPIHDSSSDLTIPSVTDHIKQQAILRWLDQLEACTSHCALPTHLLRYLCTPSLEHSRLYSHSDSQMAYNIYIDSLGSMLTIQDDRAVHSLPLSSKSKAIRISGPNGENEYKLSQIPLDFRP